MQKIIYCGDMGGDDLWAMVVLNSLIKQQKINLLGITTCFGNTNIDQATRNICDMLGVLNQYDIPVYQGASGPISGLSPLLDGAYGENGLSNATLPTSSIEPQSKHAVEWMDETLNELNPNEEITLVCTGPLTNIATVFKNHPHLDKSNIKILWLGGSLLPAGGGHLPVTLPNGDYKLGNITHFAEFNAINDPIAAQIIADLKNVQFTIIPLDCTHHMAVGFIHGTQFLRDMKGQESIAIEMLSMLDDAAIMEETKFNIFGACLHDPQVIIYLTNPELFLQAVPVCNIKFTNNDEAAKNFDAVQSGFDFSLLGNHGQMSADKTNQSTNTFIIPGLTSFVKPDKITKEMIKDMQKMASNRWDDLTACVFSGLTP